jgi:hypothetical protein
MIIKCDSCHIGSVVTLGLCKYCLDGTNHNESREG